MLTMGQKERVLKIILQQMMSKGIAGTCACGFWSEKISEYENTLFFSSFPLHQFLLHFSTVTTPFVCLWYLRKLLR